MSTRDENYRLQVGQECTKRRRVQTNVRYSRFYHELYTAGDRDQFSEGRQYKSLVRAVETPQSNVFVSKKVVRPWEKYKNLTARSVTNTFEYLFKKFKKGIFVQVFNNEAVTFLPFSNVAFTNEWSRLIKVDPRDGTLEDFLDRTSRIAGHSPSRILPVEKWTANNALVRYEYVEREYTNNLTVLHDMYRTLCWERRVPDVEFFVNRKDYPLLTKDGTEPYNHLYGSKEVPMPDVRGSYAPIFSSASSERYADILVPTYEDWLRVLYQKKHQYIEGHCNTYPIIAKTPWDKKIKRAVFRGASTGAGFDADTNKRLKAFEIGKTSKLLDIGITKWNTRPRKYETETYLRTIERNDYPVADRLTPQEQSRYAYVVHIEGHSAAFRLSYEMSFGSVLLIVDSEWKLWFSKYLTPMFHYVPVKADLSDLVQQVQWCIDNDEQCRTIAENALEFYEQYLSYDGVLDYLQKTLIEVSQMVGRYTHITDIISTQLQLEKENVGAFVNSMKWVKAIRLPTHKFPESKKWRHPNTFAGYQMVFHATPGVSSVVERLFKSKKSHVDLVDVGMLRLVRKISITEQSKKENLHENFIALNALNRLGVKNFAFVYGPHSSGDRDVVYSEHVTGQLMSDWLKSRDYSANALLSILVQLNLALVVAQNRVGFVHYDLYPWNIVLHRTKQQNVLHYRIDANKVLRFTTDLVPIVIDFGKSRAVVYDRSSKCVRDHGILDLYRSNKILDTLTILVSSLHAVADGGLNTLFAEFFEMAGLPSDAIANLGEYKKYSKLFGVPLKDISPMDFVNFVVRKNPLSQLKTVANVIESDVTNPFTLYFHAVSGDHRTALYDTMHRILSSSVPNPVSDVEKRYSVALIDAHSQWLKDSVARLKDEELTRKWKHVYRLLTNGRNNGSVSATTDLALPKSPRRLEMDDAMTMDEITRRSSGLVTIRGDYPGILYTYSRMMDFDIERDRVKEILDAIPNKFDYLSNIAKNNTLLWMRSLI